MTWHNTKEIAWYTIKEIRWYTSLEIHWYTLMEIRHYASSSNVQGRFDACEELYGIKLNWEDVPKGAIVGFVDVVGVIDDKTVSRKTKKWFFKGSYGYVLENPLMLKVPVPAKPPRGAISFWYFSGATLRKCLMQIPKSRLSTFKPFEIPDDEGIERLKKKKK